MPPRLVTGARADEVAGTGASIDLQSLYEYLHFHCIPAPRTVFRGVQRVPAGHGLRLDPTGVQVDQPQTPSVPSKAVTARMASFDALKGEFLHLLSQAVADRLDGSQPACFLSGGTDSSTVAAFIGRVAGRPAATFSIGFEAEGYDEMGYARIAAQAFGCEHHEHYVTPDELVSTIPQVAASFDQPFGNSSAVPAYCCARQARQAGVTRLLAGDGGDELFGGNTRYARLKVLGWYQHLSPGLRRHLIEPMVLNPVTQDWPLWRKLASYVRQARVPLPDRMHGANLLDHLGPDQVLQPAFLRQIDRLAPREHQRAVWAQTEAPEELDRILAYDWRYTLAENDLVKVRGATALAGVEASFPMLDERLVDFSRRLPASWKVKGLRLRWFFKEALRDVLPPAIITKRKQGFGLPFGVWATRHRALYDLAEDSVHGTVRRGIVRPDFAQALLRHHLPERPGYYGEMIWILMMLEQWLRVHAPDFET